MAEIAYLMGRDGGSNAFYTEAKGFFDSRQITTVMAPANQALTLRFVLDDLHRRATAQPPQLFDTVHVVTHANAFGGVEFALDPSALAARGAFTGLGQLRQAHDPASAFKPYSGPAVTSGTTIQLDGCDIGRHLEFLKLFGLLFGQPRRVLGSRRVVMFMHEDGKHHMVPCRTWSIVWKPPAWPEISEPKWKAFRATFVSDASMKFGPHHTDALGIDAVQRALEPIAATATQVLSSKRGFFFVEETFLQYKFSPPPADDQAALQARLPPLKSATGEPSGDPDDTHVATVINAGHFMPLQVQNFVEDGAPARRLSGRAMVVVLAKAMQADVDVSDRSQYAEVTFSAPLQPSPGPKAAAVTPPDGAVPEGGGGPPADAPPQAPYGSPIEQAREAIAAAGGDAAALDALLAGIGDPPAETEEVGQVADDWAAASQADSPDEAATEVAPGTAGEVPA